MKQYLSPEQTAKLIELGFEKPKNALPIREGNKALVYQLRYTIGELIEMLPPKIGEWNLSIERYWEFELWIVCYNPCDCFTRATELIDAIYNMIAKLNEE